MKLTMFDLSQDSDVLIRSVIGKVSAGRATEIIGGEELLDLNYMLSKGSAETRLILVEGDSMCPEIGDGDFVIVACDRQPQPGEIVIAEIDGGFTIKRFKLNDGHRKGLYLVPANDKYETREVVAADNMKLLGVVTYVIRNARYL
jgi:DNA polymerase V